MFKWLLFAALGLASFAAPSSASIVFQTGDDIGDGPVKSRIRREMFQVKNETGQVFRQQSAKFKDFKKGFYGLKEDEIVALFGSKIEKKPSAFALPLHDSGWLVFSGFFDAKPDKSHTDFYEIGDFAAAEVFYGRSGERVRGILFYLRVNETFPKLEDWSNLKERIEWETSRLAALETVLMGRDVQKEEPKGETGERETGAPGPDKPVPLSKGQLKLGDHLIVPGKRVGPVALGTQTQQ